MKLQGFSGKKSLEHHLCHVSGQGQPRFKGSRGTDSPLREGVAYAYKEGGTWCHGVPLQSITIHFISECGSFLIPQSVIAWLTQTHLTKSLFSFTK